MSSLIDASALCDKWCKVKGFQLYNEDHIHQIYTYHKDFEALLDTHGHIGLVLSLGGVSFHLHAHSLEPNKHKLLRSIPVGRSCSLSLVTEKSIEKLYQDFLKAAHEYFQETQRAAIEIYENFTEIIHNCMICDPIEEDT